MTSAVAYVRVSGSAQLDGDGFARQGDTILKHANAAGYEITATYQEEAVPGKTEMEGRPAFQEMIAALLSNGCRTIIIEGLDRLAREYRVQEQLIIYLASKGLTLISANTGENVTEAMMGDPMRRALVQIQGIFAELDKNMIVAKLAKARKRKRENGGKCEGRKVYGFRPGEQEVIRRILDLRADGRTLGDIAHRLNAGGTPTRAGRKWTGVQVKRIIEREKGETK